MSPEPRVVVVRARRTSAPAAADVALGAVVVTARAGLRLALAPARLLARATPGRAEARLAAIGRATSERGRQALEEAAGHVVASSASSRVVDAALAGPLPEDIAHSLAEHHVVERLAASPELTDAAREAVERALTDPEMERTLERVLAGPAVRAALAHQTSSLADEVADGIRTRAASADDVLGRVHDAGYAGLVSRGIAVTVDAAVIAGIVLVGGAALGLVASLVGEIRPAWLVALLLAAAGFLVSGAYFLLFWTVAGQTPGMRLLHLRVRGPDGLPPRAGRSIARLVGLLLAIVPLFAGFLPVLFDRRRRGLHDFLAGTVVVFDDTTPAQAVPLVSS